MVLGQGTEFLQSLLDVGIQDAHGHGESISLNCKQHK